MATILVINAQAGLALAIETALRNANYRVIVASSAQEAVTMLGIQPIDMILLGDTPAGMVKEMAVLKQHAATDTIPVILQSDDFILQNPDYRKRLGATAVMGNPHSTQQLISDVSQWVQAV